MLKFSEALVTQMIKSVRDATKISSESQGDADEDHGAIPEAAVEHPAVEGHFTM